ncbi:PREDICTED: BRCA1-associated protein-like [Priapulus caudatus]|uniref:BRCA1-associated protein-like n=1 Tax=Priapulus caudatus TaxID=37621 RepID=A0ABM1DR55_PRICU|nr:PREDICTED: BRCA1-associated protein-like [Priapulus caudatus]
MLISLVVLKFEIDDDYSLSDTYSYTALKYVMAQTEGAVSSTSPSGESSEPHLQAFTYADVVSETKLTAERLKALRGKRDMQEISIETVYEEGVATDSDGAPAAIATPLEDATEISEHGSITDDVQVAAGADNLDAWKVVNRGPVPDFRPQRKQSCEQLMSSELSRASSEETTHSSRPSSGKSRHGSDSPTARLLPAKIPFYSGNPAVEVTKGILHLFKENQLISLKDEVARSEMVCMLAVPAFLSAHDILQFTAPVRPNIQYIRIIRNQTPNEYMVLVKFHHQSHADEFYKTFSGIPFNSLEPDRCHLVYVSKVEIQSSQDANVLEPGLTELPTCPVCLERMDESVNGILTILCNHSFHDGCLFKWSDSTCPVCRYTQTPEQVADNNCFQCGHKEDLWLCLICGHVGCGRYAQAHAFRHFGETQHTYSMQLGANRVWDYVGDNYVHRLLQNKTDGKLVQYEARGESDLQDEKLDSITLEYTYLLTSQLESQRLYFEDKMSLIERDAYDRIAELESRAKSVVEECEKLQQRVNTLSKEKQGLDKKNTNLLTKFNKVMAELQEEKEMNKFLRENQQQWQDKVTRLDYQMRSMSLERDTEIADLKEQLRDVMFYLEAQDKIKQVPEDARHDIEDGHVTVGAAAPSPSQGSSRRGRRKK